jgi:hypothetical protein
MKRLAVIRRYTNGLLQGGRFANRLKMMNTIKRKSGGKSGESGYIQMGINNTRTHGANFRVQEVSG